ncbi:MAG: CPBP family glutamic-type intramembrane protease [Thermoleophilia bacterium]
MTPDYYAVLGVHPFATRREIDKRFRLLAVAINASRRRGDPEAESRLRELAVAHATLRDAGARAWYDQRREPARQPPRPADESPGDAVPEAAWVPPPEVMTKKIGRARRIVVPWTAWDVFAIVGLVIGVYILISMALATAVGLVTVIDTGFDIGHLLESPLANSLTWLTQWCLTLGVAFTYLKLRGYQLSLDTLGFRRTRPLRAAGLTAAVLVTAYIIQAIYVQYILPEQEKVTDMFGTSVFSFLLSMAIVAIMTPVVEEMFFRGIIHQGLQQQFGFFPGALISSTIFMLAHISYTVFVPIFCLGFGFAILTSRTKSIWPSIVAHFLWNSLGVVASFFAPDS